jgi:hypothetical protein
LKQIETFVKIVGDNLSIEFLDKTENSSGIIHFWNIISITYDPELSAALQIATGIHPIIMLIIY